MELALTEQTNRQLGTIAQSQTTQDISQAILNGFFRKE
jgi:hypothetical protein